MAGEYKQHYVGTKGGLRYLEHDHSIIGWQLNQTVQSKARLWHQSCHWSCCLPPADQFQCAHGKKCIEQSQVCDGMHQCQDRSDELGCAKQIEGCAHQCDDNSRCIPNSFVCDGERDCWDGTDEANCGTLSLLTILFVSQLFLYKTDLWSLHPLSAADEECSATDFSCTSGQCVSAKMRCDGHPDCRDRSDEEGCTIAVACTTKHRCPQSKECLVQEWICDGDQDCKDGTDEKVKVNTNFQT